MLASCRITLWENMSGKIWTSFDRISGNCLWSWIFSFNDKMTTVWENCFLALFGFSIWRFSAWEIFTGRIWTNEPGNGKTSIFPHKKNSYLLWGKFGQCLHWENFFWRNSHSEIQILWGFLGQNLECFSNSSTHPPSMIISKKRSIKKNTPFFAVLLPFEKNLRAFAKPEKNWLNPKKKRKKSVKTWSTNAICTRDCK